MALIKKYIGLSLSFCIQDILQGKVDIADISCIVTATAFESINEAFEHYFISYWSDFADEETCKEILHKLWPLVMQPRLKNAFEHRGHTIGHGFWLNTETGELTKHL